LIVMGAEPPTRIRGGAILGGIGGARPPEVGPVTEYVLKRAPCPVLVIAPPAPVVEELLPTDGGARE
jgi:APA family basic amino acid/polyamine antiporter